MHISARSLYNRIYENYHHNRRKASNDVSELPEVLSLLGNLKGKRILDMGCGLGIHAKQFLDLGAIVTGYDASEKMLQLAQEYCEGRGTFFRATHEDVRFSGGAFDICNASLTINYSKDIEIIFKKVHAWLR